MGFSSAFLLVLVVANLSLSSAEQSYQRIARDMHNALRKRHHVGPLAQSDDLNNRAVQCAQYYANKGQIDHSCPHKNGAGENLWAQGGGSASDEDIARRSTNAWYAEVTKHDFDKDWQPSSGHFTQLVWKGSNQFGFGAARKGNSYYGCGLYKPHGNIIGAFKDNVFRA